MSFLETVYQQVRSMHLPASSNDVCIAMKNHESMGVLSPVAKREKVRKALADLRTKRKVLISWTDDDGILWWNLAHQEDTKPQEAVSDVPEKLPELSHSVIVMRQMLREISRALLKAADDL
jgi:hypothetical protein